MQVFTYVQAVAAEPELLNRDTQQQAAEACGRLVTSFQSSSSEPLPPAAAEAAFGALSAVGQATELPYDRLPSTRNATQSGVASGSEEELESDLDTVSSVCSTIQTSVDMIIASSLDDTSPGQPPLILGSSPDAPIRRG